MIIKVNLSVTQQSDCFLPEDKQTPSPKMIESIPGVSSMDSFSIIKPIHY